MRKLFLSTVLAVLAVFGFSSSAIAADEGSAEAVVVTPLAISETQTLQYGSLSVSTSGGTIASTDGAVTGDVSALTSGNTRADANIRISGTANQTYDFTLPATVTLTGTGSDMSSTLAFVSGDGDSRSLNGSGVEDVAITGVLTVGASQTAGSYSGTYDIAVAYE